MPPLRLRVPNEAALAALAERLAQSDAIEHASIELQGDLGAGKTTFVRHLLRALGVTGRIKSPTYAVVESYRAQRPQGNRAFDVWHFDYYRLSDPREWEDAGFRDLYASPGLKLAEWPERVAAVAPRPDCVLRLSPVDAAEDARCLEATAHTPTGERLLAALSADPAPPSPC